jgi:pimeloyl-ACP methyl ester carboxylesterase
MTEPTGCGENGLLLLPGMMCDARLWRHQIRGLGEGYEICVGDIGYADSVGAIAREVLAAAPSRFSLAGLSMGGIVALEMWRLAPQRIKRLALLDTNFRADTPERRSLRDDQIERVAGGALESVLRDELKPNYLAHCHQGNSELLDEVLAMGLDLGKEIFVRQSQALRDRPDSTGTLPDIDCPTLVLCGSEDDLCPVTLHREMAAAIPGAWLRIIDDCGHLSTMEQPDKVTEALRDWLLAA